MEGFLADILAKKRGGGDLTGLFLGKSACITSKAGDCSERMGGGGRGTQSKVLSTGS